MCEIRAMSKCQSPSSTFVDVSIENNDNPSFCTGNYSSQTNLMLHEFDFGAGRSRTFLLKHSILAG